MTHLMRDILGNDWHRLPPALQAHYRPGPDGVATDKGHLDISYPRALQPLMSVLYALGALVNRRGDQVATTVVKRYCTDGEHWARTMTFDDGQTMRFNSVWKRGPNHSVIEYVNPILGLEMQPYVVGPRLHYRGVRFVITLGRWHLGMPEWLLGHTTILEEAIDDGHFKMDFRLTHPLWGQVFRYSGTFRAGV